MRRKCCKAWYSSPRFWRVFPWLVSTLFMATGSFGTLVIAQSVFREDREYVIAYVESLAISLLQGWFFWDVVVIVTRNNLSCTRTIIKNHRYQTVEKFVLAPLSWFKGLVKGAALD